MNKTRKIVVALSFLVVMCVLLSGNVSAQSQEWPGGLFGYTSNTSSNGMMNRGRDVVGSNLNGQGFGATEGNITGQTFGAPLGSGLFVLLVAGAGYATLRAKKKQQQTRKENKA